MNYIPPQEVVSPKRSISNLVPVFDKGQDGFSVAVLDWEQQTRLALRWNGSKPSVGSPQSRGLPTWFVMPPVFDGPILETLVLLKMLGGGQINRRVAEQEIRHALEIRKRERPESPGLDLERKIIEVVSKLKAEGKL